MTKIKLTKNELRGQQQGKRQLERYLPTLQMKKAMLQSVVLEARQEIAVIEEKFIALRTQAEQFAALLVEKIALDPQEAVVIEGVNKDHENIAGVEVPIFRGIVFKPLSYSLFDTPPWIDEVVAALQALVTLRIKVSVIQERKHLLEEELRQVAIRVNLFEKVLIPRAMKNIKKIKVFLGDEELASVCRAKVAKAKIEERKMSSFGEEWKVMEVDDAR